MKYMGSKRAMLKNGLGHLLQREVASAKRFVDLFSGSSAVATHVASSFAVPVLAYDLQRYSIVLANATISRRRLFDAEEEWRLWYARARIAAKKTRVPGAKRLTIARVHSFRTWAAKQPDLPITAAYGGHYFSPNQAVWLDALRLTVPREPQLKTAALAALVVTASQCAAAPGHTAQPFQPTRTSKPFLQEAWSRRVANYAKKNFLEIAQRRALATGGVARRLDANRAAKGLRKGDLAFVDPPYSGVHYSRFYHVLETVCNGRCGEVSGVGRYPAVQHRPQSRYSLKGEAKNALAALLKTIASRQATAILTFPDHVCSNGLSGEQVRKLAKRHFRVSETSVKSKFSTLGGTPTSKKGKGRAARLSAEELVLLLRPIAKRKQRRHRIASTTRH